MFIRLVPRNLYILLLSNDDILVDGVSSTCKEKFTFRINNYVLQAHSDKHKKENLMRIYYPLIGQRIHYK